MRDLPRGEDTAFHPSGETGGTGRFSRVVDGVVPLLVVGALGCALAARMADGWQESSLAVACEAIASILALGWLASRWMRRPAPDPDQTLKNIFDSAGPMVIAIGLDGAITKMNPAAEGLLGYYAGELVGKPPTPNILAPEEGHRLIAELQRITGIEPNPDLTAPERLNALIETVRALPPSQVPAFEAQFRRKDGTSFPVALHVSALRDQSGVMQGLLVVALDVTANLRQDLAARESQERYRDLFENSTEMIATLSPVGQFLYANPAWKRCFGLNHAALLAMGSFEELFGMDCRADVAALFRRSLDGEMIDRAQLRNHTADGRVLEFELSLSQRQKAGHALAVRCLLRDVTQQKQREHRLALQLMVSQLVGENSSPEIAATRILEAVCVSQGWNVAIKWEVNSEENRLEYSTAWATPGRHPETMIQESMGRTLQSGEDLPGRAWLESRPVWISDLAGTRRGSRTEAAVRHDMASGWAVPVRVGNKVLAVLEFYCHMRLREDPEALAAVETAASSLGQMLARTRERGRAEELYRQQEILLNSVADGICGIDRHGKVSFANPAAARLLGAPASRLAGKPIHDLLHGSAPARQQCGEECPLRRATDRQVACAGEDTIYRANGTAMPAEYFFTPILDQGRFSGSVLSFRDISQRYALDRLKDEFISTVSHELRTPLTSIRGALGLLSSGILSNINDKAANLLRIAVTNSDRLVRLINDILDLERIQSGKEPIAFRPMQLSEVVRQAIDGMQPVADAAGVQLIHDTTQAEISGDADRLLQVLTNLLSNAIKFSIPNSTVSVMTRPGASGITLSVIDQGRGIPADKLEAIFGRFQQVDASDSRQKGGSGLGLAICRTIVLQHAGRIWAERNPVRGSTFRVFLPYKPETVSPPQLSGLIGQGTVLVADANRLTRPLIVDQLARHGYRVVEATTVEQAIAAAREGVEAILVDTSLDGMNGWEILPLLRRCDPDRHTPIVLLSLANQNPAELPMQAEGWVIKPVEEDALMGELARVLCGPGEKVRILIVEDDEDLARVIAGVFALENIEVRIAHTRQEAMDGCFRFQPHLMVLDIGLPDGDGFNVVDGLRQREELASLPLVVYSGRDLAPEERRQLTLGPTHFLTKARVQPQQLEALVLTLLRNSRQMEEAPPIVSADRNA
ncbi:MAG TPA: PAS domain S-box protein [Terracidiphilus sp.]|jgi:PAS domain S-box-containing protein|nr:PAS domain S-box protein [Terracidiphilus sp.]